MKFDFLLYPLLLFIGGCCFGPVAAVVKLCYDAGFSPADVTIGEFFYGLIVAALIFGIYAVIQRLRKKKRISRLGWRVILKICANGVCIAMVTFCYFMSLQYLPAHISIILLFQYAWMGIIIDLITKKKKPGMGKIISAIIIIFATILAAGVAGGELENLNVIGVLLGLAAGAFFAVDLAILGSFNTDKDASIVLRAPIQLFFGLIVVVILMGITPFTSGNLFNPELIPFLLILAVLSATIPTLLFSIASPKVSTGLATILSSSELPASIICSLLILSEEVTGLQWIGIVLMFFGIAFPFIWEYTVKKRKERECS